MKFKIASYNISGGFYKKDESIDYFDKEEADNIDTKMLDDIIRIINEEDFDVICFQEIITTKRINYINRIIEKTNLKYESHFELSPCNIVKETQCGVAILSKYLINDCIKKIFTNPRLSKTTDSGKTYYSYDKGLLISNIEFNDTALNILTHIGFPFRRFNAVPEDYKECFIEFDNIIKKYNPDIITGDFNSEFFIDMMPYTKENYIKTINEGTTDDGKKFDNILVKNNVNFYAKTIKSLSDHFIVVDEIELIGD